MAPISAAPHASAPWTMPSFASIFTGLYPEAHGAEQGEQRLVPNRLTLAEVMREAGYQTTAVISGEYVDAPARTCCKASTPAMSLKWRVWTRSPPPR